MNNTQRMVALLRNELDLAREGRRQLEKQLVSAHINLDSARGTVSVLRDIIESLERHTAAMKATSLTDNKVWSDGRRDDKAEIAALKIALNEALLEASKPLPSADYDFDAEHWPRGQHDT